MTTAAHVLLPREVGEAICVTLNTLWYRVNSETAAELRAHIRSLDAALNAPEMWERLEDGALSVPAAEGPPWIVRRIVRWASGKPFITLGFAADSTYSVGDDAETWQAICAAILHLAAAGEGRG